MSCAAYKWDGFNPAPARVAECKGILGVAPAAQALGATMPGFSGIIPTPYNEFWYVQVKLNLVDQLTQELGSQTGDYFSTSRRSPRTCRRELPTRRGVHMKAARLRPPVDVDCCRADVRADSERLLEGGFGARPRVP